MGNTNLTAGSFDAAEIKGKFHSELIFKLPHQTLFNFSNKNYFLTKTKCFSCFKRELCVSSLHR